MDGRSDQVIETFQARTVSTARSLLTAGLALCAFGLRPDQAGASPIRRHQIVVTSAQSLGPAWSRFLGRGASFWEVVSPPRFPSGLVLPTSNGGLVETPFVDYLLWRRSLDPARFDHYHPNVGPELGLFVPPPRPTPLVVKALAHPRAIHPAAQSLPEPGMFATALSLSVVALLWRRRETSESRRRG